MPIPGESSPLFPTVYVKSGLEAETTKPLPGGMAWAIRKTLNRLQAADAEVTQARQDVEQKYARKDPETGAYLPCCEVPYDFDRWAGLWRD